MMILFRMRGKVVGTTQWCVVHHTHTHAWVV